MANCLYGILHTDRSSGTFSPLITVLIDGNLKIEHAGASLHFFFITM